jgi:hypothetical protein
LVEKNLKKGGSSSIVTELKKIGRILLAVGGYWGIQMTDNLRATLKILESVMLLIRDMHLRIDMTWKQWITHLHVKSDFKVLIDMVTEIINLNGSTFTLVRHIEQFLTLNWEVRSSHSFHEKNKSVDWLTNFNYSINVFSYSYCEDFSY